LRIVYYLLLSLIKLFYQFNRFDKKSHTKLVIEAGEIGWSHIDYQEQYLSACEYLGEDNVVKSIIDKKCNYVDQVSTVFQDHDPSHYFYDCRSGSDIPMQGLFEAYAIAKLCIKNRIIPICHLTDLPHVPWRLQVNLISSCTGVLTTLMSPKSVRKALTAKRVIGPVPMAFSKSSFEKIQLANEDKICDGVITLGSMYEPRKSFVDEVEKGLQLLGIPFARYGRDIGSKRISDDDYWRVMQSAKCVLTTGFQLNTKYTDDFASRSHLIYRYLEVLVSGSTLIADRPEGIERIFTPGEHFLDFRDVDDAVDKISKFMNGEVSVDSSARIKAIVEVNLFWLLIDYGLEEDSFK
jgi:hypothetical protein